MDIREGIKFSELQEFDFLDTKLFLSPLEHAAIASGVNTLINDREVLVVDEVKDTFHDSIHIIDAYNEDPHGVLTPTGIILKNKTPEEARGKRSGKKVSTAVAIFGEEGIIASYLGTKTGIIPQSLNSQGEVEELHVFVTKDNKQAKPEDVGADLWKLTPTFEKIFKRGQQLPNGTMVFHVNPPTQK